MNINLEISLKPFYGLDSLGTRAICDSALQQWSSVLTLADSVSVMFWAADGSEILEYAGDPDADMEWARYIGNANSHLHPDIPADPEGKSLHARAYLYREDARPLTYRRLGEIARHWRESIASLGKQAQVGLTFDPGGEFAPSDFKYVRHREICLADTMGKASFACCYGLLHADSRSYAGFPQGIPEGTSLGTFLGRQFEKLADDLGFDFLWLSNGFGFGMETWMVKGPLFDGQNFEPSRAGETRDRILGFWRDFRKECPHRNVMTRGTNLGTGTDLASDATPLRELYEGGFGFDPPPNSPWAALNGDFGIELAGYMTRIAELPPGRLPLFRYYIHDPWWLNSPWLDRYERQAHDIYLPLSISRIAEDGRSRAAENISILTLDDSYGRMPGQVPQEVTPHLLQAWRERPDQAGPFLWLYPFDELHDGMFGSQPRPERLFHTDWFVREAINAGLPLNTVISTRAFDRLGPKASAVLQGSLLVAPAPMEAGEEVRLLQWIGSGASLLIYGPLTQAPGLRSLLDLKLQNPLEGEMGVESRLPALDTFSNQGPESKLSRYHHRSLLSGGGLCEASMASPPVLACGKENRALAATVQTESGAKIWWLRGPLALTYAGGHLPLPDDRTATFPLNGLVRQVLEDFGWTIAFNFHNRGQKNPVLTLHRHRNGWFFSGYMPDTTVSLSLGTPYGAPLLLGRESLVENNRITCSMPRAWRHECRVFIGQMAGIASCIEELPGQVGVARRLWVRGLESATLRFFPATGSGPVTFWDNPEWPYISGNRLPQREVATPHGRMIEAATPVQGTVLISW